LKIYNNLKQLIRTVRSENIKNIDLRFTDLFGRWHNLTLPVSRLNDELFKIGVGFDGSNFPGFSALESGDLALIPDIETAFVDPTRSSPTMVFIASIVEADSKKSYSRDPRSIAKKAEALVSKYSRAERSMWSAEFEFYIFDSVQMKINSTTCSYEITPSEGLQKSDLDTLKTSSYHSIPPEDVLIEIRDEIVRAIESTGVKVMYHHHEVGQHGQMEIEIEFLPMLKAADYVMIIKYLTKVIAAKHGKIATFMPKPIHGEPGNGMHFHQFLSEKGKSLFYSKNGYAGLSKLAHQYIAGLLKYAASVMAFTNPSTNSYKRLVPGFEAPVNCFFALANRSAAVRIPKYVTKASRKRIEFRSPDATCNPYLAMAAQLMAGLDGIRRKLDPTAEGLGPFDINIFELPEEKRKNIKPLPGSLTESLQALKENHEFLLMGNVFNEEFIKDWIRLKQELEIYRVNSHIHPVELELYLNC